MSDHEAPPPVERLHHLLGLLFTRRQERNVGGYLGLPPTLTSAAWRGDLEMVELFLEKGGEIDEKTVGFSSPLAAAMRSGNPAVVKRLLAAGARPDAENAADAAAERGRTDLLAILFETGLDPLSRRAQFALTTAAVNGKASSMRYLIARGVTMHANDRGFAATMALANGHDEIAALLRGTRNDLEGVADAETKSGVVWRREPAPEDDWSDEQIEAEALSLVWRHDVDLEQTNVHGESVLQAAISAESVAVAEAALDRDANRQSGRGRGSALGDAAAHGIQRIVERLAPAAPQCDLDEALVEAAKFGLPSLVETLLRSSADPTFVNRGGESAFALAAGPHRDEIRRLIRQALRERDTAAAPALGMIGKGRKNIGKLRGVSELVKSQVAVHPDWTILAWRKPIDEASPRLAAIHGAVRSELDIARRGAVGVTAGLLVFALAGHPWTIELRAVGFHRRDRWQIHDDTMAALSRDARCEALLCTGSDTSGTFGAFRYDNGECLEKIEWTFDGELQSAHSADGSLDRAQLERLTGADAYFAALDLFLPGCRVHEGGVNPRLDLVRIDPAAVTRVDYLVLEE